MNNVRKKQHNAKDAGEQCETNYNTMLKMQMNNVTGITTHTRDADEQWERNNNTMLEMQVSSVFLVCLIQSTSIYFLTGTFVRRN